VFLNGARTDKDWIVGRRGEGWIVSRSTLKHERNMIGNSARAIASFQSLVGLARETRRNGESALRDPETRQRLVELEGYVVSHQYSGYIQLTRAARSRDPGLVQLMNKLVNTNIGDAAAHIALDLLDDDGMVAPSGGRARGEEGTDASAWTGTYMGSLGSAIAGGTANIQRNIIAERGLGLPRDEAAQRSK